MTPGQDGGAPERGKPPTPVVARERELFYPRACEISHVAGELSSWRRRGVDPPRRARPRRRASVPSDLAVGVPGEDLAAVSDAGMVHMHCGAPSGHDGGRQPDVVSELDGDRGRRRGGRRFGPVLASGELGSGARGDLAVVCRARELAAHRRRGLYGGRRERDTARDDLRRSLAQRSAGSRSGIDVAYLGHGASKGEHDR